jgi:hypothetical protein
MILRLSQKLNTKIKAGKLTEMPLDENPYADWSCHLFTADQAQYIIMSNTKSLYSCVMHGAGITGDSRFIERAFSTIGEFMEEDGQAFAYQRFIAPAIGSVSFAKALNRSVTGSMNDLVNHARHWIVEDEISPLDLGFRLNEVLLSALARSKTDFYWKPREAFKQLADRFSMEGKQE